jgi:hypothetical protein
MNAPAANAADRIDPRRLIAFMAMCFGMFMALLDIQIVSASLSEIQAGDELLRRIPARPRDEAPGCAGRRRRRALARCSFRTPLAVIARLDRAIR